MSPYPPPGRISRKWRKLRRDPVRFFADAASPAARNAGLLALAALRIVHDIPRALAILSGRMLGAFRGATHLRPVAQLRRCGELWESTGEDPQFEIRIPLGLRSGGWARFRLNASSLEDTLEPVLYIDDGGGFREQTAVRLAAPAGGRAARIMRLPRGVRALRLDPMAGPGLFRIDAIDIEPLTVWEGLMHSLSEGSGDASAALAHGLSAGATGRPGVGISREEYARWVARHDRLGEKDRQAMRRRIEGMVTRPVISIVMPVFDSRMSWLREAVDSVLSQIYPHWELCIVDDASSDRAPAAFLAELAARDSRVRFRRRDRNGGIVAASNDAIEMASGEWIVTLDHDDRLAEHALYQLAAAIDDMPDAAIFYSDHDHLTPAGERANPYFKPDWNYELALGQNLANHLTAFRREDALRVGGFRDGFDGSQDWDLLLRLVEDATPDSIHHIPHILYHWRIDCGSFSQSQAARAWKAGQCAVQAHLDRTGQAAVAMPGATSAGHLAVRWRLPEDPPLVSIVIPTRDRVELLRQCMDGLGRRTAYPKLEIILVDNGSEQPETLAYYDALRERSHVRIIFEPGEFNFSKLCNRGVEEARGEVYVLLNNDVDPITPEWLGEMVSHALRPGVGAVGAKLYYPDGSIQHAGVILGLGGVAGHAHAFLPNSADGYHGRARLTQRLSAVTGACLAGRRQLYREIGGLDEENLKVAFNDVDFCLRLGEAGYRIVWTPFAELYHHESASRGPDNIGEKADRFRAERSFMQERWGPLLARDPAYHVNLDLTSTGALFGLDRSGNRRLSLACGQESSGGA